MRMNRLVFSKENRTLHCPTRNTDTNHDVNAAHNILHAGLRFSPLGLPGEALKGNPDAYTNPWTR